ncbi:MAG TPA: YciI family protein [Candidatus Deferrimicrobiaceae bacterium]
MRFMMIMIPRVYQPDTPPAERAREGFVPPSDAVARMMKFNEEMARAGALVALDGLHPAFEGTRVSFAGGRPTVTKGPFAGAKDVVGGYWIIEAKSRDEAVEWARRCPAADGDVIEVRRVFEASEFPEDVRQLAESPTVRKRIGKRKIA